MEHTFVKYCPVNKRTVVLDAIASFVACYIYYFWVWFLGIFSLNLAIKFLNIWNISHDCLAWLRCPCGPDSASHTNSQHDSVAHDRFYLHKRLYNRCTEARLRLCVFQTPLGGLMHDKAISSRVCFSVGPGTLIDCQLMLLHRQHLVCIPLAEFHPVLRQISILYLRVYTLFKVTDTLHEVLSFKLLSENVMFPVSQVCVLFKIVPPRNNTEMIFPYMTVDMDLFMGTSVWQSCSHWI